jgi:hypothetical protein
MNARLPPATTPEQLLILLREQRAALLGADPAAIGDLESSSLKIEQALASLAGLARQAPDALAALEPAALSRLRAELQANQTVLASLASGNRRALNALFGEPPLYGR